MSTQSILRLGSAFAEIKRVPEVDAARCQDCGQRPPTDTGRCLECQAMR